MSFREKLSCSILITIVALGFFAGMAYVEVNKNRGCCTRTESCCCK